MTMRYLAPLVNNGPAARTIVKEASKASPSTSSKNKQTTIIPFLRAGEFVYWMSPSYKGIWHRKLVKTWLVTNERILLYSNELGYVMEELALENINDIVLVNQRRSSNASFSVYGTGGRGSRYMTGNSKAVSQLVGDLVVLHDSNAPFTTLTNVNDAIGLAKLIHSLIKQRASNRESSFQR